MIKYFQQHFLFTNKNNFLVFLTPIWLIFTLLTLKSQAQVIQNIPESTSQQKTRILFIFDASMSMSDKWENTQKFVKARELMFELLDSLEDLQKNQKLEVALRVYGHQSPVPPQDCTDSKLEISFSERTIPLIRDRLMSITPKGTTPIAYSLTKCEEDFPDAETRNIVILITDGIEMCQGDPCEISASLQKKGLALKPYIIGIAIDAVQADILACMGNYFDAANEGQFRQAIKTIVAQVSNYTAVRVNLLDQNNLPTETNVVMSFHDTQSGAVRYNYMHTMDENGQPDTIFLDILSKYNLKIHTVPPVYLNDIKITEGYLNEINVPAPQGTLVVDVKGNDVESFDIQYIIKQSGKSETLHTTTANRKQKLLVGSYDLEILTLPRIVVKDVKIEQSKVKKVAVGQAGTTVINFKNATIGTLFHVKGDLMTDVYEFSPDRTHYKLRLQPGKYKIVYREQKSKTAKQSAEFSFRVKSGEMNVQNL